MLSLLKRQLSFVAIASAFTLVSVGVSHAASRQAEIVPQSPAQATAPTETPTSVAPPSLVARVPAGLTAPAAPGRLGSLDPQVAPFEVTFSGSAAGISRIVASNEWLTVRDKDQAERARASGDLSTLPADDRRYVFAAARNFGTTPIPLLGAREVQIDGASVDVFGPVWAETALGTFVTEIANTSGVAVARVTRTFTKGSTGYDIVLSQRVENLTAAPMKVRLIQYGPGDPPRDPLSITEVRRFHFGYLYPESRDPGQTIVSANGQLFDRSTWVNQIAAGDLAVWPNKASVEGGFSLSWFGSTDRYFAVAVHAPYAPPTSESRRLESVAEVRAFSNEAPGEDRVLATDEVLFTSLWSPTVDVAAGASTSLDLGLFAGPLDGRILGAQEPFAALRMDLLIVYLMSGCCSWCTFAWLADGMLWFLAFLHDYVVFDWGLAIIALVIVVRLALHKTQKKSQISMQRFSRAMQAMKPELDALQKKFKDDPARMQQEQMRLFKEKGVSPAGCVAGLLPTFAQMPIWMALYATLFFAYELRQQPAFFGIFQEFGGWLFLADLSEPDRFISLGTSIDLWLFTLSSINLLPVLMGIVFFIQQKYMAPPMTPNMTEEQIAQQKMMKWMMVIMFPLMTYAAPSGLTLYILTSTCIGIVEGRIIKKQVDAMDLTVKPTTKKSWFGSMIEQALTRAQEQQKLQQRRVKGR
jgi:YidC/Oxa1 family membrane protein insertase